MPLEGETRVRAQGGLSRDPINSGIEGRQAGQSDGGRPRCSEAVRRPRRLTGKRSLKAQ